MEKKEIKNIIYFILNYLRIHYILIQMIQWMPDVYQDTYDLHHHMPQKLRERIENATNSHGGFKKVKNSF